MDDITFVGLDVHKATVAVAVAESGRAGEVRRVGVVENRPAVLAKVADRLAKDGRQLSFCYEAGPCGVRAPPLPHRAGARVHDRRAGADPGPRRRPIAETP